MGKQQTLRDCKWEVFFTWTRCEIREYVHSNITHLVVNRKLKFLLKEYVSGNWEKRFIKYDILKSKRKKELNNLMNSGIDI